MTAYVIASGSALPERIVTNDELAPQLGLAAEQIVKSSGIKERRWAEPGSSTSKLSAEALSKALEEGAIAPGDIDYLILGTMTPDRLVPGSAPAVQKELGLRDIPCLDIRAACCNTLYGLQVAKSLVTSKIARNVALSFAEIQSAFLDLSPQAATTSMLFGDGAAALIVSCERTSAIRCCVSGIHNRNDLSFNVRIRPKSDIRRTAAMRPFRRFRSASPVPESGRSVSLRSGGL